MCDTLIAMQNATKDNSIIFGKNSDREPNEPQVIIRIPGRVNETGKNIKCTYIEIAPNKATNEVILSKPTWIWGAEMGINDKGVVIGNEAVFTKEKLKNEALLGMDMIRLALECCDTAIESVEYMIELLERYGQGGKAGYTANLRYHNSFIVADHKEAYVLETAGKHWAVKKIDDVYTISNSLTLRDNFDKCSNSKMEKHLSFKDSYDDKLYTFATKGDYRKQFTENSLRNKLGEVDVSCMIDILRSHCGNENVGEFKAGSMKSICMHGGGVISSQTTGSMAVHLKDGCITMWTTGTSLPCISLYKPLWFIDDYSVVYTEHEEKKAEERWRRIERLHRKLLTGSTFGLKDFIRERNRIEAELMNLAAEAKTDAEKAMVMKYSQDAEQKLYENLEASLSEVKRQSAKSGSYLYNAYWKRQNDTFNM